MSTLTVTLDVPAPLSIKGKENAERCARESAIISLWQDGELSTRQAAAAIALTYYDFLNLLSERGIPIEPGSFRSQAVHSAARKVQDE